MDNVFIPSHTDFSLSPYTGLTRESWIDAAKFLLENMFANIPSPDAPVIVPRAETEVTYPHKNSFGDRLRIEEMAERFEGLARSLFIAAPLIHIDPKMTVCGFDLREYYSRLILRSCDRTDPAYIGTYDDLLRLAGTDDTYSTFQQTVETCALVICLDICRGEIWERYTKEERDTIASLLMSYAHKGTVPQNWRLFNMLVMAFLHKEGYEIDHDVMREHASVILGYYAGDGWYRDGHSFDYYSCWAFNVYAPIWNRWYGYEHEPYIAAEFEKNSDLLVKTYPDFFDRDGFTNMWGRSSVYRFAAVSPLAENLTMPNPAADPGLARRIASGSLLQFLTRDDLLVNGVPSMGFYRPFTPLIQGYSCAESAYWLGKAFLCLALPEDSLFWTAKENNGSWDALSDADIKETALNAPGLCFTNHGSNGETLLRTGKVMKRKGDTHGMWNYSKLCYNSKYPWEASPADNVESMQYVLKDRDGTYERCNATFWRGLKDGVLYRRQFFDYELETETHWRYALDLADFPVANGILRADRLRLFRTPIELTLGSYGFPDNGTHITERECDGAKAVILKGHDHTGREKQLAMTIYDSRSSLGILHSSGTNPDSEDSIVIYAKTVRTKQYGNEGAMLISQVITKESLIDFTDDELFPIAEVGYTDSERRGAFGPVTIRLKNGETKTIDHSQTEGELHI